MVQLNVWEKQINEHTELHVSAHLISEGTKTSKLQFSRLIVPMTIGSFSIATQTENSKVPLSSNMTTNVDGRNFIKLVYLGHNALFIECVI